MSERTYFSYRYALPGFTFLIMVIFINLEYFILEFKSIPELNEFFGIILGILTLLSGFALGFLISQIWHVFYNRVLKTPGIILSKRSYGLLSTIVPFDDIPDLMSKMSYSLEMSSTKRTIDYINRMTDIINTLASTSTAIISGWIIGYILHLEIFNQCLNNPYDGLVLITSICFLICLIVNAHRVWIEHDSICHLIIRLNQRRIQFEFQHME